MTPALNDLLTAILGEELVERYPVEDAIDMAIVKVEAYAALEYHLAICVCGKHYVKRRSDHVCCSPTCRKRKERANGVQ